MAMDFLHGVETIEVNSGIRPIQTVKSSVIGLIGTAPDADEAAWPLNTPILLANEPRKAATLGGAGTLKDAIDGIYDQAGAVIVVVRVEEGADIDATLSNVVGDRAFSSGVHAFTAASSEVKVTPRILCAPGFTGVRPGGKANPVIAELTGIADRMRAIIVADGPNSTDIEAITYREDWGSARLYIVDPHVLVWDTDLNQNVAQPASARVAGVIARMDQKNGFHWSPSNQLINGITGIARPITFGLSDKNSQANLLNEQEVTTIVQDDGYRLWGSRSAADDPMWAFLPVRRVADMVYESIERNMRWPLGQPLRAAVIEDIVGGVEAYFRSLKARDVILGGRCWVDPEMNTPDTLKAGKLFLDFDIEPAAPIERITFRAERNDGYYTEMIEQVAA